MKAFLKNYRQSPRKVRLVADLIKGEPVSQALVSLSFLTKRASDPMKKLVMSALANAKQMGVDAENLFVKDLRVDKGLVMKRMMPRAMGRASRINKRTSHITLVLGEKIQKVLKEGKKTVKAIKKVTTEKTEKKIIAKSKKQK